MRITEEGYVTNFAGTPEYKDNEASLSHSKFLVQDGDATLRTNSTTKTDHHKLNFDKSKNDTPGEHGSVLTENTIGKIQFRASGDEQYNPVSAIHSETTKDMTDSGGSGNLIFSTANNQTITRERMIIHPEGTVQIGTRDFSGSLNVTSTTRIANTLSAGGVVYLNSDLSVNSKLYLSQVDSNINFNKTVNINGRTNIDNNLSVSKKTFLSWHTNIRGTLNVSKSIIALL